MNRRTPVSLDRPAKAGVFIVLLLAVAAAAGAVYWFKFRVPPTESPATPPPAQVPVTPPASPSGTKPPGSPGAGTPAPQGQKPSSIFDEASDGSPGGPVAPPPVAPVPTALDAQKLKSLETARRNAAAALEAARAKAKTSSNLAARAAEVAELKVQLDEARKSGTPQEKVEASGKWNKARLSLEEDQKKGVDADPAVVKAAAALDQAEKNLRDYRAGK